MKSKDDIHMAIAVLIMMSARAKTDEEKRLPLKVASALSWVLDYPSRFDTFMDKVKENPPFNITPEELDKCMQESIKATNDYLKKHNVDDDGHAE